MLARLIGFDGRLGAGLAVLDQNGMNCPLPRDARLIRVALEHFFWIGDDQGLAFHPRLSWFLLLNCQ